MAKFNFFNDPEAMLYRLFYKGNCQDKNKKKSYDKVISIVHGSVTDLLQGALMDKQGWAEGIG